MLTERRAWKKIQRALEKPLGPRGEITGIGTSSFGLCDCLSWLENNNCISAETWQKMQLHLRECRPPGLPGWHWWPVNKKGQRSRRKVVRQILESLGKEKKRDSAGSKGTG